MPWIVIGLAIGLVAVGVAVAVALVAGRRGTDRPEMSGDQLFTLGVVFTGTGLALALTINLGMLGMMALGIVYMAMGARMKRAEADDKPKGMT